MQERFVGRVAELARLAREAERPGAALTVIYGRRRLGKTSLIRQFLKGAPGDRLYYLVPQANETLMLKELSERLSPLAFGRTIHAASFGDLLFFIEEAARKGAGRGKFTLVLDEFPRLVQAHPAFESLLQGAWDTRLKSLPLHLILCGSSISMMESIIGDRGRPLFGRRTSQIVLPPLSLADLKAYYGLQESRAAFFLYGVLGGTPYYWEQFHLTPNAPLEELLADQCFRRGSIFLEEGHFLLREEIREPRNYLSILETIARGSGRIGAMANTLSMKTTTLTPYLETLTRLHILTREPGLLQEKKQEYVIADPFIGFWFQFIRPNLDLVEMDVSPREVVRRRCRRGLGGHFAQIYERQWRQALRAHLASDRLRIGRLDLKDKGEIDIAGLASQGAERRLLLAAECKFSEAVKRFDLEQLDRAIRQAALTCPRLDVSAPVRLLIWPGAPSGIDPQVMELAFPDETLPHRMAELNDWLSAWHVPSGAQDRKGEGLLEFSDWTEAPKS